TSSVGREIPLVSVFVSILSPSKVYTMESTSEKGNLSCISMVSPRVNRFPSVGYENSNFSFCVLQPTVAIRKIKGKIPARNFCIFFFLIAPKGISEKLYLRLCIVHKNGNNVKTNFSLIVFFV